MAIGARLLNAAVTASTDGQWRHWPLLIAVALFLAGSAGLLELTRWQEAERLERLGVSQARELDRQLQQLTFLPRLLADDLRIQAALASGSLPAVEAANQRLVTTQQGSGLAVAFLLNTSGNTVASSNFRSEHSFVGRNYGFRPYFIDALNGESATFFGVGATTGEPGYFIASPVAQAAEQGNRSTPAVSGVVVAKMDLNKVLSTWRTQDHASLVLDDMGTIILATEASLLYRSTRPLTAQEFRQIAEDRRYTLTDGFVTLQQHGDNQRRQSVEFVDVEGIETHWQAQAIELPGEPWTVLVLSSRNDLLAAAALRIAALAGLLAVGLLLWRTYFEQRRLADMRRADARKLEALVTERTHELERAQAALIAQSNFEMLGRLSAAVNHEINQPLASLRLDLASCRTLLDSSTPPLSQISQIVADSDRTTQRIARVIATLRSLVRERVCMDERVLSSRLLSDVAATARRELQYKGGPVEVIDSTGSAHIVGNQILLQQALLNLVNNALDAVASSASAHVRIEGRQCPDHAWLILDVIDNGPGIDPQVADRLFEPFASTRAAGSGLGLGLVLAKQIAEDHGGRLVCEASSDAGAQFRLTLPIAGAKHSPASDFQPSEHVARRRSLLQTPLR